MDFPTASTARRVGDGQYVHAVPDGWQQGPGAFGGLVLGLMARTAIDFAADASRPLRTLSGAVLAPVLVGDARLTARTLRQGSKLTAVNVQLEQQGQLEATADVVLAASRVSDGDWQTAPAPSLPAWRGVDVLEVEPPFGPVFAKGFEYRPVPPLPFSGAADRAGLGWVRSRAPGPRCDAALVVALIDAWWPAPFSALEGPRPMSTVAFTFQLFIDPSTLDPNEPLVYRASSPFAVGGYTLELRELWTADGRAVAQNQQTFVMIK